MCCRLIKKKPPIYIRGNYPFECGRSNWKLACDADFKDMICEIYLLKINFVRNGFFTENIYRCTVMSDEIIEEPCLAVSTISFFFLTEYRFIY